MTTTWEGGGFLIGIPMRIRMPIRFPRQVRAASLDAADASRRGAAAHGDDRY